MVRLKRCQVIPFTHSWYRWESEDYWHRRCLVCDKHGEAEPKGWYFADRTDIPKVIPEKQPPKRWAKLPTKAELVAAVEQRALAS